MEADPQIVRLEQLRGIWQYYGSFLDRSVRSQRRAGKARDSRQQRRSTLHTDSQASPSIFVQK